jgi:Glycosyltransferase WbsX
MTSQMNRMTILMGAALLLACGRGTAVAKEAPGRDPDVTVACYYFGQYHPNDPRNLKERGGPWSEWELIKAAKQRFPGHAQPKVPQWGHEDESDPRVMAKKIDAAADHGIDAFIFDWYYYEDGPFLDRTVNEGFLKAKNNDRIKFSFMWANHDWMKNIFPYTKGEPQVTRYPGKVSPAGFERITDHLIKDYFKHSSYWRIDDKPYFSFYDLNKLLESFGSIPATRTALDAFRAKAVKAGLPGLHLNAVVWGEPILPGEKVPADPANLVRDLGFDSVTSYVWIHHYAMSQPQTEYDVVRDGYFEYWDKARRTFDVPYYPNVSMGWDPSPRCDQSQTMDTSGYPFTSVITGNTPAKFENALRLTKERLLADPKGPRILNINCWNEWTEGSYLEPDTVNGMGYLEAVKRVSAARVR